MRKFPKLILTILASLLFISILAMPFAYSTDQVFLKDITASLDGDSIEFKLEVESAASDYITVTPEILFEKDSRKISEKLLQQYILFPNKTNTITFYYSRSFFSQGEYEMTTKLHYDKSTSNILSATMAISETGDVSIAAKKDVISPTTEYMPQYDSENTLLYLIILVLVVGLMAPRLTTIITALKSRSNGDNLVRREEHQELLSAVSQRPETNKDNIEPAIYSEPSTESIPQEIETETTEPPAEPKSVIIPNTNGKDINLAVAEEKKRLKEELDDLDRLYEKEILDDDIYLKNKKAIEDKLSRISVENVMKSDRSTPAVKKVVSKKLSERKAKLENSLKMLEKLYSDQLIDDETFEKNKSEIDAAMKKLDEA